MKRIVFLAAAIVLLNACGSNPSEKTEAEKKKDSIATGEEIRTNMSLINDFNALEGVFGNDNWMKIDNKDTVYYYFSRLSDFDFNTYQYKLVKGDSGNVVHGKIKPEKNKLSWQLDGKQLEVNGATVARITATVQGDTTAKYEFTRLDSHSIRVTYPDKKQLVWRKTIPFSLFLVRSRYDYTNGTHYAFDTSEFRKKR